ncbi:Glycosyltransferase [Nitrospira tepida]|uniref:Glycosyltransferase n=1 Tax=Nitrospira tepida TaxID=2973512 RepID=A0AA86N064_9BACT|nr:glycosyltransferase [Nitrospira tepida]CAI4032259.1 Glycosyltransferase [Nitrospira tepida]
MLTSSVVVPILNAARTLPACLRALDNLRPSPGEVVLIDNGSTDESLLLAKTYEGESHPFRVQLLSAAPHSASIARNTGIKAASGDIILFTDADCSPAPDWLGRLLESFDDPKIGAVAGRVSGDPGSTLPELFSMLYTLRLPKEASLHDHWTPLQGGYPTANLAVRRTVLERLQGFDESVAIYGEDYDLCARLYAAGWRLLYRPEAQVIHHHRTTWRAILRQAYGFGLGQAYLIHKHVTRGLWVDLPQGSATWSRAPVAGWIDCASADKKCLAILAGSLIVPIVGWLVPAYLFWLARQAHQRAVTEPVEASWLTSFGLGVLLIAKSGAMTAGRLVGSVKYGTLCL